MDNGYQELKDVNSNFHPDLNPSFMGVVSQYVELVQAKMKAEHERDQLMEEVARLKKELGKYQGVKAESLFSRIRRKFKKS